METQNPYDGPFGTRCVRIPNVPTASLPAASTDNEGAIVYDSTLNALYYCDGAAWQAVSITAGVGTLQQVTTAGKTSNVTAVEFTGASSSANGVLIGDGTRKLQLYTDGTDSFIATAAGDLKIVPTGADVRVTGNVHASGTLNITGASTLAAVGCTTLGATGLVTVGSGAAAGEITSNGAHNLVLETNAGTDSGLITIVDAANGAIQIAPNGTGVTNIKNAVPKQPVTTISAGTAALAVTSDMGVITCATDGAAACTATLPDASTVLGQEFTFYFLTDGGVDFSVVTAAGDSLNVAGNTTSLMQDAGDFLTVKSIAGNVWMIVVNNGGTLS